MRRSRYLSSSSAFPSLMSGRLPASFRERDFSRGKFSRLQLFRYVQASELACLPDRSYRCRFPRRAAEAFTSEQNVRRCLRTHRICSPPDYRQLAARGLSPREIHSIVDCSISGLPSALSADSFPSLFEWFIGTMPLCDSSETYMRAVRPKPSPAELRPGLTADISEVSRFSCMKFLGVSGVFDYAGLIRNSRYRPCSCCLPRIYTASASGLYLFAAPSPTPPILYLRFTASLTVAAQDSRPSGSLLLSRKALSSSTFMPVYPGALKSRLRSKPLNERN